MNKILPIILVVVLSGCATSPKYYDRNNISWNELDECNLSVPECLALNTVCQDNPRQCRFKPYDYVHECNDTAIQCKHEETQIVKKAVSIYWDTIDSENHKNHYLTEDQKKIKALERELDAQRNELDELKSKQQPERYKKK